MPIKFDVKRSNLNFEAGFNRPQFLLFRDTHGLLHQLYKGLETYGVRLSDLRIEGTGGTAADFNILCYLFNFYMTLRIRLDRIEVFCSELPQEYVPKYGSAIVDALAAISAYHPDVRFQAYGLTVDMHGILEGNLAKDYLLRFTKKITDGLGPSIGAGTVMYFGPEGSRLLCSVTVDMSAAIPDALYVRTHVIWDAGKIDPQNLPELGDNFVRQALAQVGLESVR